MSAGGRVRAVVGVIGELFITAGLVISLFALYVLFWTGVETSSAQDALEDEFDSLQEPVPVAAADDSGESSESSESGDSAEGTPVDPSDVEAVSDPLPGSAYARMRIPRLGESWEWIVVQGVDMLDLRRGPGRYIESAHPGEIGNFAVAGHRATYGEPFAYLDRIRVGDEILVERAGVEHRYVVTDWFITTPDDVDVLAPVPSQPGVEATEAFITLTTCHPRFGSTERLIVHGVLVGEEA